MVVCKEKELCVAGFITWVSRIKTPFNLSAAFTVVDTRTGSVASRFREWKWKTVV